MLDIITSLNQIIRRYCRYYCFHYFFAKTFVRKWQLISMSLGTYFKGQLTLIYPLYGPSKNYAVSTPPHKTLSTAIVKSRDFLVNLLHYIIRNMVNSEFTIQRIVQSLENMAKHKTNKVKLQRHTTHANLLCTRFSQYVGPLVWIK